MPSRRAPGVGGRVKPEFRDWLTISKGGHVAQTFLSASWGDFPVAPMPAWKVRRTGRLGSLPHTVWP
jgi:hypothetical protein